MVQFRPVRRHVYNSNGMYDCGINSRINEKPKGTGKMKVKIEFTVNVNPDKWADEYGTERKEVREDVKSYFSNCIPDYLVEDGTIIID